jgi:DNA-binding GntR family transcriptional regulator
VSVEPLSSLDRTTLRERAMEALRSAITSGQYRPGDHLGEVELASTSGSAAAPCGRRCATCSRRGW